MGGVLLYFNLEIYDRTEVIKFYLILKSYTYIICSLIVKYVFMIYNYYYLQLEFNSEQLLDERRISNLFGDFCCQMILLYNMYIIATYILYSIDLASYFSFCQYDFVCIRTEQQSTFINIREAEQRSSVTSGCIFSYQFVYSIAATVLRVVCIVKPIRVASWQNRSVQQNFEYLLL